ncbi:unnamed protein product, partial [Polarella glacialis]
MLPLPRGSTVGYTDAAGTCRPPCPLRRPPAPLIVGSQRRGCGVVPALSSSAGASRTGLGSQAAAAGVLAAVLRPARPVRPLARLAVLQASDAPDPVSFCPPPTDCEPEDDGGLWDFPEFDYWEDYLDAEDYEALLEECASKGDWQGAASKLEEMRSHGHRPEVPHFREVLRACRRGAGGSKASELINEMWKKDLEPSTGCYGDAIAACHAAGEVELAAELLSELRQLGASPQAERFHLVPKISWGKQLGLMGCSAHNTVAWDGKGNLPPAPAAPCWLIPTQDDAAVAIAEQVAELRKQGWKVLSCDPRRIDQFRNKAKFRQLADRIGLLFLLPVHYNSIEDARFPCILKPAIGTFGKDTHIVRDAAEATRIAPSGLGDRWLLQELVSGDKEYSTSLLVSSGEILDSACIRYTYSMEEY